MTMISHQLHLSRHLETRIHLTQVKFKTFKYIFVLEFGILKVRDGNQVLIGQVNFL